MNIPVQTVQQDQKEEISIKKKFSHKRRCFDSSYSNKSSEEETSSSPEEGETVTIDAKEYKMFLMWRRRMERFHKHRHCFMKHHHRRHRMIPPFGPFGMPPRFHFKPFGHHRMIPPFGLFGMPPHPHKHFKPFMHHGMPPHHHSGPFSHHEMPPPPFGP